MNLNQPFSKWSRLIFAAFLLGLTTPTVMAEPLLPGESFDEGVLLKDSKSTTTTYFVCTALGDIESFNAVLTRDGRLQVRFRFGLDWEEAEKKANRKIKMGVRLKRSPFELAAAQLISGNPKQSLKFDRTSVNERQIDCSTTVETKELARFWYDELRNKKSDARLRIEFRYKALSPETQMELKIDRQKSYNTVSKKLMLLGKEFDLNDLLGLSEELLSSNSVTVTINGKVLDMIKTDNWLYQLAITRISKILEEEVFERKVKKDPETEKEVFLFSWTSTSLNQLREGNTSFTGTYSSPVLMPCVKSTRLTTFKLYDQQGAFYDFSR